MAKKPQKPNHQLPARQLWKPQEGPQLEAILATWCNELLFGGARGGGKSQFLLGDFLQDVHRYGENWKGLLLRRSYRELEDLILESKKIYPQTGGEYFIQSKQWRWPNGSMLQFGFIERDADAESFQGFAWQWLGFDELGNYPTDVPYKLLIACLRNGAVEIPTKRIRASANPGGVGHHWLQHYFKIVEHPGGFVPYDCPLSGMSRMFIPSKVTDNKILMAKDPGYINRLKNVGSEALVRAWLEGDWSAIQGAFFEEFSLATHVIPVFEIPEYWPRWAAMDWGYAKPFSVGFYTIADGSMVDEGIPAGSIIQYDEWYGASEPNKGLRLPVDRVAAGIRERIGDSKIEYLVCDPSMFIEDGGPSLAEAMMRPPYRLPCIRGDNKRIPGWNRVRTLMRAKDGPPKLFFTEKCIHSIRTIPIQQHDKVKAEDLDTTGEDHVLDQIRYSCMSRIDPKNRPPIEETGLHGIEKLTLSKLWQDYQEQASKPKSF